MAAIAKKKFLAWKGIKYIINWSAYRCMRSVLLLLLILAASSTLVFPSNAPLAEWASVRVVEAGRVSSSPGEMHGIVVNVSIPSSDKWQSVYVKDGALRDGYGNNVLILREDSTRTTYSYSKDVLVNVSARKALSLQGDALFDSEKRQYVSPTSRTQSDDPLIEQTARTVTEGAGDDFEKVARIAAFVHENVAYDESYLGRENDARYILGDMRGVCVEYTTLFIALARAEGIPARYVTGYAYGEEHGGWVGHAWAEVYVNGTWIGVDPTWMEAGDIDALHIVIARLPEIGNMIHVSANVPAGTRITWEGSGTEGALANNIETLNITYGSRLSDYSLSAAKGEVEPGESTEIVLSVEGDRYRVIPVLLVSCSGAGSFTVAGGMKYLVLEPGKNATARWTATAPASISKNLAYNCPLTLNSPYLELRTASVIVAKRSPAAITQKAAAEAINDSRNTISGLVPGFVKSKIPPAAAASAQGSVAGQTESEQAVAQGTASRQVSPACAAPLAILLIIFHAAFFGKEGKRA